MRAILATSAPLSVYKWQFKMANQTKIMAAKSISQQANSIDWLTNIDQYGFVSHNWPFDVGFTRWGGVLHHKQATPASINILIFLSLSLW